MDTLERFFKTIVGTISKVLLFLKPKLIGTIFHNNENFWASILDKLETGAFGEVLNHTITRPAVNGHRCKWSETILLMSCFSSH